MRHTDRVHGLLLLDRPGLVRVGLFVHTQITCEALPGALLGCQRVEPVCALGTGHAFGLDALGGHGALGAWPAAHLHMLQTCLRARGAYGVVRPHARRAVSHGLCAPM